MRQLLAVVLVPFFLLLLLVTITVNQVVNTVTEPETMIGIVNDAEAYDYLYDNIVANLVGDMVEQGIEISAGLGDSNETRILEFDDPEAAAVVITGLIETMVPRE